MSLLLWLGSALGGQCGELVGADSLREMVTVLQQHHLYVTCESPHEQEFIRLRLPEDATALSAAQAALAACPSCAGRYEARVRGDRVEIRLLEGPPLLGTVVTLTPGHRYLTDVIGELEAQLTTARVPEEPPAPIPGFETRSTSLERMKAEVLANSAPGLSADELAAQVARLDAQIAQARVFEAEAAEPCDP